MIVNKNLSATSLDAKITEAEDSLSYLIDLKTRQDAGLPCPDLKAHFTNILIVAGPGNMFREEMVAQLNLDPGDKFGWLAYRIEQCMLCLTFILADYEGKPYRVITESQAKRWLLVAEDQK